MTKPIGFLDPDHPFFRKAVTRWLTTLVPLAWATVEFINGAPAWGIMFGAAGAYAGYKLLIVGPSNR
ncbi:hypothetical protein [Gemmobacter serpentinus]|uniref:hypothetical protein n=1 Tax=Gemmobacter serpentinus TaxID=2652247 RepID=UPI001CF6E5EE|nr:hypothetical protein [Gemmobacter serpentinus]